MAIFGPVPSRRLGRSLGVNNIPPKICSYACAYCQLGRAIKMQAEREEFYSPGDIYDEVSKRLEELSGTSEYPDYLSFVPDGEPLLDKNIGKEIRLLKNCGPELAVICNSSLLHDQAVREELSAADWVSVKVDSIDEAVWRKVNRPVRSLSLEDILEGIKQFRRRFMGKFVTETMLLNEINDQQSLLEPLSDYLAELKPDIAYISIPTRPPAEKWALAPKEEKLTAAFHLFQSKNIPVEFLISYEGDAFSPGESFESDVLSICSVHPMRQEAVDRLLEHHKKDRSALEALIENRQLRRLPYQEATFYLRKLK